MEELLNILAGRASTVPRPDFCMMSNTNRGEVDRGLHSLRVGT